MILGLGRSPREGICLPTPGFLGFPGGSAGQEFTYNVGDTGSMPGLGRSPGEGENDPLQYSGLENPMDCIVHEVVKSWTQLTDFHFQSSYLLYFYLDLLYWLESLGQCSVEMLKMDQRVLFSTVE